MKHACFRKQWSDLKKRKEEAKKKGDCTIQSLNIVIVVYFFQQFALLFFLFKGPGPPLLFSELVLYNNILYSFPWGDSITQKSKSSSKIECTFSAMKTHTSQHQNTFSEMMDKYTSINFLSSPASPFFFFFFFFFFCLFFFF